MAQLILSIRNREQLRHLTGDPWDGRSLCGLAMVALTRDRLARFHVAMATTFVLGAGFPASS